MNILHYIATTEKFRIYKEKRNDTQVSEKYAVSSNRIFYTVVQNE